MSGYDPTSCNDLAKPFYKPIEAAIRWCGLWEQEREILDALNGEPVPVEGQFPWVCLRLNTLRIIEAMDQGELSYSRDGKPAEDKKPIALARRTVRHDDLKAWMVNREPGKKPTFLFDEVERRKHSGVDLVDYQVLQTRCDALEIQLAETSSALSAKKAELKEATKARDTLQKLVDAQDVPSDRSEISYRVTIAALLRMLMNYEPPEKTVKWAIKSEAVIIRWIEDMFSLAPGISTKRIQERFDLANQALDVYHPRTNKKNPD
ncbi:MAG: hypothetical protein Q7J29_06005 [Stagnimonas sp.]|nr:hypothetical protein [Stagnimonas sp.]